MDSSGRVEKRKLTKQRLRKRQESVVADGKG
jgi:hypothetical protein